MADTHCVASPVGTITSVPNFLAPEWHGMRVPPDGPLIRDGCLKVPEGPGLGVDLNESPWRASTPARSRPTPGVAAGVKLSAGMYGPGDVLLIG